MPAERGHRLANQRPGARHPHKGNEIPTVRKNGAEGRRILLAARRIRKIADGFERDHRHDWLAALGQQPGIAVAAHAGGLEVGRLLVHEQHQPQPRVRGAQVFQEPGQFQNGRGAGPVVVGARRIVYRIVVRANHDGFCIRPAFRRLDGAFQIANGAARHFVGLRDNAIARRLQRSLDVLRRLFEAGVMRGSPAMAATCCFRRAASSIS